MFRKISIKIFLFLFAGILSINALTGFLSYLYESNQLAEDLHNTFEIQTEELAFMIANPLWNFDNDLCETILRLKLKNKSLIAIVLYSTQTGENQIHRAGVREDSGQILIVDESELKPYIVKYYKVFTEDITYFDEKIGKINVYFNDSRLRKNRKITFVKNVIQVAITLIFLIIVVFISINQLFIKPILKLNKTVNSFSGSNFQQRSEIKSNDEIGELAESFNNLAETIHSYSQNLENLVRNKTADLRKANEIMKKDLHMAQKIQLSLMPEQFPGFTSLKIQGAYLPMEALGGDFYDVFEISNTKTGILIADVSGHGVPAAMITTMAKIAFSQYSKPNSSSKDIITNVNSQLHRVIGNLDSYITAFYVIIDTENNQLEYTSAGHTSVFLARKTDHQTKLTELESNTAFLGSFSKLHIKENEKLDIISGDRLVLFTDGIPETRNENNDFYGEERLKNMIIQEISLDVHSFCDSIINDVRNFRRSGPVTDDITILAVDISIG